MRGNNMSGGTPNTPNNSGSQNYNKQNVVVKNPTPPPQGAKK